MSKALSRKARKRNRVGGQNKREDVPRYSNGRIDYRQMERNDRAQATVIDARMRLWGLTEKDAKLPTAGTVFGRMYLQGEVTPEQYEAGNQFHARRQLYQQAISAPPPPRSGSDLNGALGRDGGDGADDRYVRFCAGARRRYADVRRAALEADGFAMFALEQVICEDKPADERVMGSLRAGLNGIARMLRIEKGT